MIKSSCCVHILKSCCEILEMQHTFKMQHEECEAHDMRLKYGNMIKFEYLVNVKYRMKNKSCI
jgi:hypothetical protein